MLEFILVMCFNVLVVMVDFLLNGFKNVKDNKVRESVLYFDFNQFVVYSNVYKTLERVFSSGNRYSLIVRVAYIDQGNVSSTEYKMLGDQYSYAGSNKRELDRFADAFQQNVLSRLEHSMDIYNYTSTDLISLQVAVYLVGDKTVSRLPKFIGKQLGESRDLIKTSEMNSGFNNYLPLIATPSDYGVLLGKIVKDSKIESVILLDGTVFNINDSINKHLANSKRKSLSSSVNVYQKDIKGKSYILSVFSDKNVRNISVFSMSGLLIHNMVDTIVNQQETIRKIGNVKAYINEKGLYRKDVEVNFSKVYPYKMSGKLSRMIQPDWRFGTMDLETYMSGDISKVYASGFHTKDNTKMFYLDEGLTSDKVILNCLDSMLNEKYNGFTFYIHNFGKFDLYFIYRVILNANTEASKDIYQHEAIHRDSLVLSLRLSTKKNGKSITIKLCDSYNLLQGSLRKLCKTFNTEVKKGIFPYKFVNENTLHYIGNKPDISFYLNDKPGMSDEISMESYHKIAKDNWSVKDETLSYLEGDLVSLYHVMDKFIYNIYLNYHTHVTRSLTISSLSMDIFLRRYYKDNIPLITQKSVYNNIRESYYGGITEVYKPFGKNLYYYDVNSLYPYSALNPMPGMKCIYTDNIDKDLGDMGNDFFGFYNCNIEVPNDLYIGLLPYRGKEGLIMPVGKYEGWYFSEELKYAHENGYKIRVLSGYTFDKSYNVFDDYVKDLYTIKSTTKDSVERSIVKSLLNNLLGRFGLDIAKYTTSTVSYDEFVDLLQTRKIKGVKFVEDKYVVNHSVEVDKTLCENNGLNYSEMFNNALQSKPKITFKEDDYHDVSVAIASAINSYARVHMNRVKLDILRKGGSIYYTDTDSIVTDIKLDDSQIGPEIGKFKLEHEIKEGYFISNKTYAIKTVSNKDGEEQIFIKNKGTYGKSLTYDDFKLLYMGNDVRAFRYESKKDIEKGTVLLNQQNYLTISWNSYRKRVKIFDSNNLWIDTKPIKYNEYHTSTDKKTLYLGVLERFSLKYLLGVLFLCTLLLISYTFAFEDDLREDEGIESKSDLKGDNPDNVSENVELPHDSSNNVVVSTKDDKTSKTTFTSLIDLFRSDRNTSITKVVESEQSTKVTQLDNSVISKANDETPIKPEAMDIVGKVKSQLIVDSEIELEELRKRVSFLEYNLYQQDLERSEIANSYEKLQKDFMGYKQEVNNISYAIEGSMKRIFRSPLSTPHASPKVSHRKHDSGFDQES